MSENETNTEENGKLKNMGRRSYEKNMGRRSYDEIDSKHGKSLFKDEVQIDIIMHNGTHLTGTVYVPHSLAYKNIFLALDDFFHLYVDKTELYLVNKAHVSTCKLQFDAIISDSASKTNSE